MIEDKLNQEQRIRLECIAQAISHAPLATPAEIVSRAKKFEQFIRTGVAN